MPANEAIIIELRLAGAAAFQSQARGAASSVEKIGTAGGKAEKPTGRLGKAMGTLGPLAAGAAVGGGLMAAKFGVDAVKAFQDSAKIGRQTDAVIKSTGGSANVTAGQVGDLAGKLSQQTGIDDEVIQGGENMLLTFTKLRNERGKGNDVFNQATRILTDMSAALGSDPQKQAIQLGKALNDPVKGVSALSRVGVTFDDQQKKTIKRYVEHGKMAKAQGIILRELNKEFGGSARAQATNSARLKVAMGNLQESIGGLLAPSVEKLAGLLLKLGPFFSRGGAGARALAAAGRALSPIFRAAADAAVQLAWAVRPIIQNAHYLVPVLKVLAYAVGAILFVALKLLKMEFRALGIYIRFTIGLIRAIVGVIRTLVGAAISAGKTLGRLASTVRGALSSAFRSAVGRARALVSGFQRLGHNIVQAIVNGIKSAPGAILDAIKSLVPKGGIIGKAAGALGIGRQHGGIVRRGETTLVGERGPELATFPGGTRITPLRSSALTPVAAGGTTAQFFLDRRLIMTAVAQADADVRARR